jgi:hypothetical protein
MDAAPEAARLQLRLGLSRAVGAVSIDILTWAVSVSRSEIHLRMRNTPSGCFSIQGLSPIARLGGFLARSTSHPVVARSDCTKILLAAAGLKRTRPFCDAAFWATDVCGSSTWIRQD